MKNKNGIPKRILLEAQTFEGDLCRACKLVPRIIKLYDKVNRLRAGEKFTRNEWDSASHYLLHDGQALIGFLQAGLKKLEIEIKRSRKK